MAAKEPPKVEFRPEELVVRKNRRFNRETGEDEVEDRTFVKVGGRMRVLHEHHPDKLSIQTEILRYELGKYAVVKATITTSKGTFTGVGESDIDRDPRLRHAILEMAETRAIGRAARWAGFGVEHTSAEEVDYEPVQRGRGEPEPDFDPGLYGGPPAALGPSCRDCKTGPPLPEEQAIKTLEKYGYALCPKHEHDAAQALQQPGFRSPTLPVEPEARPPEQAAPSPGAAPPSPASPPAAGPPAATPSPPSAAPAPAAAGAPWKPPEHAVRPGRPRDTPPKGLEQSGQACQDESGCKKTLTAAVLDYSVKHFGKPLCMDHQNKHREKKGAKA